MRVISRRYASYPSTTGMILSILNLVFGIVEGLIALRIVLELLGANSGSGFVQFIYSLSLPLIAPFIGIFPARIFNGGFFLDAAAILAFVVYAILWAILVSVFSRFGRDEAV